MKAGPDPGKKITLVYLPGLDGTGLGLELLTPHLPPGLEARAGSYPEAAKPSFEEVVDAAAAIVPRDRPVALLAESFSGPVALRLAARGTHDVRGVLLVVTFVRCPSILLTLLIPLLPLGRLFGRRPPVFFRRRLLGEGYASGPAAALYARIAQVASPAAMAGRLRLISAVDARDDLRRLSVPLWYLQAADDRMVPPRCLEEILRLRPDTVVRRLPGPHALLETNPRESAAVILEFLAALAAS